MGILGLEAGGLRVAHALAQVLAQASCALGMRLALALGSVALLGACHGTNMADPVGGGSTQPGPAATAVCVAGKAGCPCDTIGATVACGSVVGTYGDYVTCSMGASTCQGGQWTPCQGDKVITKSLNGSTLGAGNIKILTTSTPCRDVCDPNQCTLTASTAADVDATDLVAAPGPDGGRTAVTIGVNPTHGCLGLQCQVRTCPVGQTTTLTGTVYDPAGVHPLYNAEVYVPIDPTGALPPFSTQVSCDSCAGATLDAVVAVKTGPDGKFVLTGAPSTDVGAGAPIPLVVQLGKWRREQLLTSVPQCTTTAVDPNQSRLPRNMFDGNGNTADLPKFAIVTGKQDPFECLLLKMGVDPAEFQLPNTGPRRVDYYLGNGMPFNGRTAPSETVLESNLSTLMNYDAVLLPCEGAQLDATRLPYADNVAAYANAGGRIFATHESYAWLAMTTNTTANAINPAPPNNPNPFFGVANWHLDDGTYATAIPASIDTTLPGPPVAPFTKGAAFATWLGDIGALTSIAGADGGATQDIEIDQAKHDVDSVIAPATEWIRHAAAPNEPLSFSFNTPVVSPDAGAGDGGAGACGRVVFSDFHVSAADLTPAGGTCSTNADCGYTATCSGMGSPGTCAPKGCFVNSECPTGYACASPVLGKCNVFRTCTIPTDCQSGSCTNGSCDPSPQGCDIDGTFPCGNVETCGGWQVGTCVRGCGTNADCTFGELCVLGQCSGCTNNAQCPTGTCQAASAPGTCSASAAAFPLSCKQGEALSPQEDALEFMLFDLTSCVSPDTEPPPPPQMPTLLAPATFIEEFTSTCPEGTRVAWRELDWQATVPSGTSISFSAQTADPLPDGGEPAWSAPTSSPTSIPSVQLATVTTSTLLPQIDFVPLDTGPPVDSGTVKNGLFSAATPEVFSANELRLTVTLTPTEDGHAAPTLLEWLVKSDCLPAE